MSGGDDKTPHNDEVPIDLLGNVLPLDSLGGDFEGLVVDPADGSFWMCDEYRPAIYHFDSGGELLKRFVPVGAAAAAGLSPGALGDEVLPAVMAQRRQNRGFEGIALNAAKIYVFVQSPLRNPATLGNSTLNAMQNVRVLEFNPANNATRQFIYVMDTFTLNPGYAPEAEQLGIMDLFSNGLDASDRDGASNGPRINIHRWPVKGMYQPDAVAAFSYNPSRKNSGATQTLLVMANEGDAREYTGAGGLVESVRVGSLKLDPTAFPNAAALKANSALGRLNVTKTLGNTDGDDDYDALYAFGARSFSIRSVTGALVWDSGDDLERITAAALPANFNASNTNNDLDNRSDDKGPEPEGLVVGKAFGRTNVFVGLERIGGVVVYDITDPYAPTYVEGQTRGAPTTAMDASRMSSARAICSWVMVKAGVSCRMLPIVTLKLSPRRKHSYMTRSASSLARAMVARSWTSSTPSIKPRPRTSPISSYRDCISRRRARAKAESPCTWASRPSDSM